MPSLLGSLLEIKRMSGGNNAMELSKDQIQKYRMMFTMIDQDGDDFITNDDIKAIFKDLNMEIDESTIDQEMLANSNGKLDFNGFLNVVNQKIKGFSDSEELKDAFQTFTSEGGIDSKVLKESLQSALSEESDKNAVNRVVEEYTKENKITGFQKFNADKFIDDVKK